jgi:hypothetical protein
MAYKDKRRKAEYDRKYLKEHYERVVLELKPETKRSWVEQAKTEGKSLTGFIREAVEARKGAMRDDKEREGRLGGKTPPDEGGANRSPVGDGDHR